MMHRGFTLVELLLAMSLTILVGGVMYLLQTEGLSTVAKGTARIALQSEMRRKMERLVTDLRGALEILEVRPDYLKISRFPDRIQEEEGEIPIPMVVSYEVIRNSKTVVLLRTERGEPPVEILSADHIGENIFCPFYVENVNDLPREGPHFVPFDMHINDSDQRRRIAFMRIQLQLRLGRENFTLTTAVTMRPALSRLLQPAWHFH